MPAQPRLTDRLRRPLAWADAWMNRLLRQETNPLYLSGVLTATLLAIVLVTGVYLLFFYRVGTPYASVERITRSIWLGQWTRSLHRYASDAAVLFAVVHAVRLWLQRRVWGPRALAWISGLALLAIILVSGWTGYVMVWDVQGEVLAREGARFFDVVPLFSEPISRAFVGERDIPGAFFFLNLFAHVAIPVGAGVVLWVHVSRVARPQLVPQRALLWWSMGLLAAVSAVWPITMAPPADLFRLPGAAPYDVFFAFFLPLTRPLPAWAVWAAVLVVTAGLCAVPWISSHAPRTTHHPPSVVDERSCTGCEQCYVDCPYEAITMVPRSDPADVRSALVGLVDPELCTSCGICAGSCAPMGVGPPGRTGKDQLKRVAAFVLAAPLAGRVVLVACERGAGRATARETLDGSPVYGVECAGNLHTSVVEYLVRSGAAGVLVVSCPPRDCWNREGPKWVEQRLFHDREAELQPRVDRRRVRLAFAGEGERREVRAAVAQFRADLAGLGAAPAEAEPDVTAECEPIVADTLGVGR